MNEPAPNHARVAENLSAIRDRIAASGSDPASIRVVAVTKGFGVDAISAVVAAGISDVGENYAQELLAKYPAAPAGIVWHFIGSVQRNKIATLAPVVGLWETVDRLAVGTALAAASPGAHVMVQVNTTGEPTKGGCVPSRAPSIVETMREAGLVVDGLMTMGPSGPPENARPGFRALAILAHTLGLAELSMGMSGDLEVAVQEGATTLRIGRGLLGPRPKRSATIG